MNFLYYDLAFLALFVIVLAIFLYIKRKNVQVESKIFLLYKTKVGIKVIEKLSKILPLNVLSVISISCGYVMMAFSLFLFYKLFEIMISGMVVPNIPPIMPLIPYLPSLFKLTFLPPFYFTYWIISILIIAVSHEFSHGIFARFYKIKLKSTGFGFLGPFLAAFVELDEKTMEKKSKKAQLAILSGGPFANLIMTILFLILMNSFFALAYAPSGLNYIYALNNISISSIEKINDAYATQSQIFDIIGKINTTNQSVLITAEGKDYFVDLQLLQMQAFNNKSGKIFAYYDSPAYQSKIEGAILKIDSEKIDSTEKLNETLLRYMPNQKINLETTEKNYSITLSSDPTNSSKAFLGVSFYTVKESLIVKFLKIFVDNKKDSFVYYSPKLTGTGEGLTIFIYNLFFWIVLINISVALFNMVPMSIFDGGRFFYVTVLSLTKSKKTALKAFKIISAAIGWFLIIITAVWFFRWI